MYNIIIYVMINLDFFFSHTMVLCIKIIYIFGFDYLKPANGGHCASDHKFLTVVS